MRFDRTVAKHNPYYNKKERELPVTAYAKTDLEEWGQVVTGQQKGTFDEELAKKVTKIQNKIQLSRKRKKN